MSRPGPSRGERLPLDGEPLSLLKALFLLGIVGSVIGLKLVA